MSPTNKLYKAVILVGGPSRGTRFRPLSLDLPKPLFEVAGHPIIEHCLRAISKVSGIREVFLVGYYDESIFRDFLRRAAKTFPALSLKYLREYEALGTAGGIYHFRDAILQGNPDGFFVLNCDVCCSFPLSDMLKLFEEKHAGAVILGTRVSNEYANMFGCIVSDPDTKQVLHYVEKPECHISNLINCGVYLFSAKSIFPAIRDAIQHHRTDPTSLPAASAVRDTNVTTTLTASNSNLDEFSVKSQVIRLEQDVLSVLVETGNFFVVETKDFWRQIKTAGSAIPANALYLQQAMQNESDELATASPNIIPPVYIHENAKVDATAKLGPNVSIGARAIIGRGVRVKDSIVLEDGRIDHDACVLHAIVGWNSRIGCWSRVEGTAVPVSSMKTLIVKNGVKIQSICILGKECNVGDEVHLQNCVCLPYKELKRDVYNEVIM